MDKLNFNCSILNIITNEMVRHAYVIRPWDTNVLHYRNIYPTVSTGTVMGYSRVTTIKNKIAQANSILQNTRCRKHNRQHEMGSGSETGDGRESWNWRTKTEI